MATPLTMLGVIHRDPQGPSRLQVALAGLAFGMLSVEVSPFALVYRRRHAPRLLALLEQNLPAAAALAGLDPAQARDHPQVRSLRAYLALPFEWTTAFQEARGRGVPCLALDFSALSRELLAEAPRLVGVENLSHLLAGPSAAGSETQRRRAADLLAGRGGWPRPPAPEERREQGLARRLKTLLSAGRRLGRLPLVHVGGWRHLLPGQDPPTLADRLSLPMERRLLV